jgi:pyridoxamine-phosphate oxidase
MVLLKGVDERGIVFHTNLESRKAQELAANPRAAFAIHWQELYRQVRATGVVSPVSQEEADAYFASRPRGAQLAAVASPQSRVIRSREDLMEAYRRLEAELAGRDVPRPPHWGGLRLVPDEMELWQGRENRLHDRLRYTRFPQATSPSGWLIERLAP